jgi:pimeloyl-ACP methyl ester carboxylesterase
MRPFEPTILNMPYQIADTSQGRVSYRKLGHGKRKILFFHGFPGSSRQIDIFNSELQSQDLEVLCFDRPGYHHTQIKTADSLNVTVKIAMELVSTLSWTKFEVVTVSGGTPFGIALALQNPESVSAIRVISGLGDLSRPSVRKKFPTLSFYSLKVLPIIPTLLIRNALHINPGKRNPVIDFFLPPSKADLELANIKDVRDSLNQSLSEALEQGFLGPKQDSPVFLANWSAGAADLKAPIHFWHGDLDNVISNKVSESMAPLFPNGKMTLVKNHGHLSLPITWIGQILKFDFSSQS